MIPLPLFICLVCGVVGFQMRHMECFLRHIFFSVKHESHDPDPVKEARDKRLFLFICISMTVCCYGVLSYFVSFLYREMHERFPLHGWDYFYRLLPIVAALLAGRFFYDFKLTRRLKKMTPEQRQEEFGDGPALLTREMPHSESQRPVPEENSNIGLLYAVSSIFLLVGLVCFYLAIFGS